MTALFPILTGCEETLTDTDVRLPYRNELVVQGFLTAGTEDDTILITHTLPPLEEWSIEKAAVTDADVRLESDDETYPLVHIGQGRYRLDGVHPLSGKAYTIIVQWKGLTVTGTATIPMAPEILNVTTDTVQDGCSYYFGDGTSFVADEIRILADYAPHGNDMYSTRLGISYSSNNGPGHIDEGYSHFLVPIDSTKTSKRAVVYAECLSDDYPYVRQYDTVFLDLVEYEGAFRSYYETRWNGGDDDLFFDGTGRHPDWNVSGDGFGWFFGRSTKSDTTVWR